MTSTQNLFSIQTTKSERYNIENLSDIDLMLKISRSIKDRMDTSKIEVQEVTIEDAYENIKDNKASEYYELKDIDESICSELKSFERYLLILNDDVLSRALSFRKRDAKLQEVSRDISHINNLLSAERRNKEIYKAALKYNEFIICAEEFMKPFLHIFRVNDMLNEKFRLHAEKVLDSFYKGEYNNMQTSMHLLLYNCFVINSSLLESSALFLCSKNKKCKLKVQDSEKTDILINMCRYGNQSREEFIKTTLKNLERIVHSCLSVLSRSGSSQYDSLDVNTRRSIVNLEFILIYNNSSNDKRCLNEFYSESVISVVNYHLDVIFQNICNNTLLTTERLDELSYLYFIFSLIIEGEFNNFADICTKSSKLDHDSYFLKIKELSKLFIEIRKIGNHSISKLIHMPLFSSLVSYDCSRRIAARYIENIVNSILDRLDRSDVVLALSPRIVVMGGIFELNFYIRKSFRESSLYMVMLICSKLSILISIMKSIDGFNDQDLERYIDLYTTLDMETEQIEQEILKIYKNKKVSNPGCRRIPIFKRSRPSTRSFTDEVIKNESQTNEYYKASGNINDMILCIKPYMNKGYVDFLRDIALRIGIVESLQNGLIAEKINKAYECILNNALDDPNLSVYFSILINKFLSTLKVEGENIFMNLSIDDEVMKFLQDISKKELSGFNLLKEFEEIKENNFPVTIFLETFTKLGLEKN